MTRIRRLFAAGALAAVVAVALSSPAQAHDRPTCVGHGFDFACVYDNHARIVVCDLERDGNNVRGQYHLYFNPARQHGPWDRNGADRGCTGRRLDPRVGITWFRVCEERLGCSRWRQA
ncbi:MAG: hypothetical protein M3340_11035 [Actinomycetota bacterium]|nr:hypothetical protein [Actinomycetota bacterium]